MKKIILPIAIALAMTVQTAWADAASEVVKTQGAEIITVPVKDGIIDTMSGVVYSQVKTPRNVQGLRMTLMIPRNNAKKPAIVYFPGGGFTSAAYEKFTEVRYALARAGFVVVAAEYRPIPTKFPGLVNDGKAAVRFLRAHAKEFGIDPNHIGVIGDSAGGYLVDMLGTTNGEKAFDKGDWLDQSSDVQAVVSMYGISDLKDIGEGFSPKVVESHKSPSATEAILVNGFSFGTSPGGSILSDPKAADYASAIRHVKGKEPPFLLMHGVIDPLVSPLQSSKLYTALKAKNDDVKFVLVKNAKHGDLPWFQQPVIDRIVRFFKDKLGTPAKGEQSNGISL